MGQAALQISESAMVKEGKRCFDAPLDHTAPNVQALMNEPQGKPEGGCYSLGLGSGAEAPHSNIAAAAQGITTEQGVTRPGGQASSAAVGTYDSRPIPASHNSGFHEGHAEDAGGYFEEPMSVGDLNSLEDTYSNALERRGGGSTPPPPEPPRPVSGTTMQGMTMQHPQSVPEGPVVGRATNTTMQPSGMQASAVPSATCAALPIPPATPTPAPPANDEAERSMWRQGSILEIYSGSNVRWYPALLLRVQPGQGTPDVLTMQFWINDADAKQKSLYRSDQQLAPLATHLRGELPPGFSLKPSQSRPGQHVFMDMTTGTKYQTVELAWQTHFQRLLERPAAAGQETVCNLPSSQLLAPQHEPAGITTEHGTGMNRGPEATRMAEGLSTEYGAAARAAGAYPCQTAATAAPPPFEQRTAAHGAQLAAEMAGRSFAAPPKTYQHNVRTDLPRAGAAGAPVATPAKGHAPMAFNG